MIRIINQNIGWTIGAYIGWRIGDHFAPGTYTFGTLWLMVLLTQNAFMYFKERFQ